ncbi:unnamed protein product, partial [Effrenium voratum]
KRELHGTRLSNRVLQFLRHMPAPACVPGLAWRRSPLALSALWNTSWQALVAEQRSIVHDLLSQTQLLELRQDRLTQEAQRAGEEMKSLREGHQQLLKDFGNLQEEFGAARDCLTGANLVSRPALDRKLSRRRAPRVLQTAVEDPGLSLALGHALGVVGCMRFRETTRGLSQGLGKCLPLLKKRMPPDIYVLGGKNDSSPALATVECFSPLHGEWRAVPPMTVKRYGCAAATVNGQLYVVGGHDGQKTVASAERFDPSLNRWTRLPDLLMARSRCAAVAARGALHVLGGRSESRAALPTERFSTSTNKWQALPPMPLAPLGCAAAELSGFIYAVGVNADRNMIVEVFDPVTCRWSTVAPVPRHRFGVAAAAVAGSLYIAGGHNGQKAVAELERCDCNKKGHWELLPNAPNARHGSAAAAAAGSFYLIGGDDGKSLASVERFDPTLKCWVTLPPLPTGRFGCAAAVAWG